MYRSTLFTLVAIVAPAVFMGSCQMPGDYRAGGGLEPTGHRAEPALSTGYRPPVGIDLQAVQDFHSISAVLETKRVVFVGEIHTRYDHHLNQLEVIKALHRRDPKVAVGMEFFQRPFQPVLDAYVAGTIDEAELLARTEYYDRWRYDYRLYRPILQYARENGLPLVALNMEHEITRKVGAHGTESLTAEERARLPDLIDRNDPDYVSRLRRVFQFHPGSGDNGRSFENFLHVQLLWDETMAQTAAEFLHSHPDYKLVVLAGSGHVAYGNGIPDRLVRRINVPTAIVVQGDGGSIDRASGDFLLLTEELELPPKGKLGIYMADTEEGVRIEGVMDDSGAQAAGISQGDYLRSVNGALIRSSTDVRIAMLDQAPGDEIDVVIRRGKDANRAERALRVTLKDL
jgi:uncharacterized iron-regulated protein